MFLTYLLKLVGGKRVYLDFAVMTLLLLLYSLEIWILNVYIQTVEGYEDECHVLSLKL